MIIWMLFCIKYYVPLFIVLTGPGHSSPLTTCDTAPWLSVRLRSAASFLISCCIMIVTETSDSLQSGVNHRPCDMWQHAEVGMETDQNHPDHHSLHTGRHRDYCEVCEKNLTPNMTLHPFYISRPNGEVSHDLENDLNSDISYAPKLSSTLPSR